MAVARDANSSSATEEGAKTSHNHVGKLTIGAGSNRALIGVFETSAAAGGTPTMTNNPDSAAQAMTLITSFTLASGREIYMFGLIAPNTGSSDVRTTTINSVDSITNTTSYTGVDQTGGTTSFAHATSNSGTSTTVSVTITSAVGNMTMDFFAAPVGSATPTQTSLFFLSGAGAVDGGASEASGAATVTHQWTIASAAWGVIGVDIVAAGATTSWGPLLGLRNNRLVRV